MEVELTYKVRGPHEALAPILVIDHVSPDVLTGTAVSVSLDDQTDTVVYVLLDDPTDVVVAEVVEELGKLGTQQSLTWEAFVALPRRWYLIGTTEQIKDAVHRRYPTKPN